MGGGPFVAWRSGPCQGFSPRPGCVRVCVKVGMRVWVLVLGVLLRFAGLGVGACGCFGVPARWGRACALGGGVRLESATCALGSSSVHARACVRVCARAGAWVGSRAGVRARRSTLQGREISGEPKRTSKVFSTLPPRPLAPPFQPTVPLWGLTVFFTS